MNNILNSDCIEYKDYESIISDDLKARIKSLMDDGYCFTVFPSYDEEDEEYAIDVLWGDGEYGRECTEETFRTELMNLLQDTAKAAEAERNELIENFMDRVEECDESGDVILALNYDDGTTDNGFILASNEINDFYEMHRNELENKTGVSLKTKDDDFNGKTIWMIA